MWWWYATLGAYAGRKSCTGVLFTGNSSRTKLLTSAQRLAVGPSPRRAATRAALVATPKLIPSAHIRISHAAWRGVDVTVSTCWVPSVATNIGWTLVSGQRKQTCCDSLPKIESQSMVVQMNSCIYNECVRLCVLAKHLAPSTHPLNIYGRATTQKQTTASWRTRTRGTWEARQAAGCTNARERLVPGHKFHVPPRPRPHKLDTPAPAHSSRRFLSSTAKQPTFATASAVQIILDEDDGLQSSQDYWSQTVRGSFLLPPIIFYPNNNPRLGRPAQALSPSSSVLPGAPLPAEYGN